MMRQLHCTKRAFARRFENYNLYSGLNKRYFTSTRHNLEVLDFDENKGTLLLRHPGFTFGNYDITGQLTPWGTLQLLPSIHVFLKTHRLQQTGTVFQYYNRMLEGATQRTVDVNALFEKELYDDSVPNIPLYLFLEVPYIGRTSYLLKTSVCNNTEIGTKLFSITARLVNVDKTTGKTIPLRLAGINHDKKDQPLILDQFVRPDVAAVYEMSTGVCDVGLEGQTYVYSFSRYAIDAVHHGFNFGQHDGLPEYFQNGVRSVRQLHKKQGKHGDRLKIYTWRNSVSNKIYHCDITVKNMLMCQCTIELY